MDISISSLSLEVPAGRRKLSSTEGRPENLGPQSEQLTTGQATESPTPQTWQEPVDFIAMVALVLEHDVHQLELESSTGIDPQAWHQKNMYTSFNLGEGASSFLELHTMRQKVDLQSRSLRKGDRVALKRSFVDCFDDDVGVTPEQYDFIKSELRVFCHQRLRFHENICKLLFVGWEEYTPAPVLGLELAEYGTLKDLLFDVNLREHGSLATHLVLDIALGLEALHDVGIVHGDVKTGNILVFAHQQRKVVAKLSDFQDSIYLVDNGQVWAPVGGTHAWRAPECYGTAEYDLKKTDVYSFGLCALAILAQGIWYKSANNTGLGDCFLVRIKDLDKKTKSEVQAQATSWKQDADNLVLRWGLEWADAFTNGDDMAKTNALFVVSACLWKEPEKRKSMDTVIWGQFEVLSSAGEQERLVFLQSIASAR
jgi:serine/threonine protein kinase